MESLAPPGTEDSINLASSGSGTFISKKNSETDRLLSLRYQLPDGTTSNIFEQSWKNGSEVWYCRVCQCPVMGQVFNHEAGKRHVAAMESISAACKRRTTPGTALKQTERVKPLDWDDVAIMKNLEMKTDVQVAPGEPVPPGFEGEITKVAQIQNQLDNFKTNSLIGLEYLLELQDDLEREHSYFCLLCGKKGDSRTIIPHLISYNHLQYYLQRHYPRTYEALLPFSTHKKYRKCWQEALNKIADAIENKYGRMLPHPIDKSTYERNKQEVYNKVNNGPHFSEKNGVSFEYLVNKQEIINISNKAFIESMNNGKSSFVQQQPPLKQSHDSNAGRSRSLSSVSSISSDEFDYSGQERSRDRERNRSRVARPATSSLYNRRRRSRTRSRSRSRSPVFPWDRSDYRRSTYSSSKDRGSREDDRTEKESKRDEFRRLAAAIEKDMEPQLRKHQMNPEKHPQYNDEWKVFWNKRYKELQAEGKDTQGYDYKPEWIVYWNKKMEEFHKAAVKQALDALRRRLGIAEVAPISFKINSASTSSLRRRDPKSGCQPVAAQPDQDHEVIVIDDSLDDKARKSRDRSHSPWESDPNSPRKDFRRRPLPARRNARTRSKSRSHSRSLSPYRRRSYARRRSRSRSRSRSKGRRYRRTTRSRTKSPQIRRDVDVKLQGNRRSSEWDRAISYNEKKSEIPFAPCGKNTIMVRESTLKKQAMLDEQLSAVETGDVNIVAVLRLLTALEDKLGSLGPKVVDLLANALSMEKKTPNSSEQLLDEENNCVMFETIKEKLKGLLHAGLIAQYSTQEKAIQTSITKIAGLLHLANKRKTEKEAKKASKVNIDRVAICKQIAHALVQQGKTNATQAELEQVVNAVVQMAEASIESSKPMTTASYLEMLKQNKASTDPPKTTIESSLSTKVFTSTAVAEKVTNSTDAMDGLSDLELQTLLQRFKDLSAEEQHQLISYLRKLEAKDPARVETLRKFVSAEPITSIPSLTKSDDAGISGRISPFSKKLSENIVKTDSVVLSDQKNEIKIGISDDEDDYSYEDVFKAANKNLSEKKQDVSDLIANIMVSIASNNTSVNTTTTSVLASAQLRPKLTFPPSQPSIQLRPPSTIMQQQSAQPQYGSTRNEASFNLNGKNLGNFHETPLSHQQSQLPMQHNHHQQPPFRQFPSGPPCGSIRPMQGQGNPGQMRNMHHYPDNVHRFHPNPNNGNVDQNPNSNYNYYRW